MKYDLLLAGGDVVETDGQLAPFESFTLRRPRRD
jgi:hypothetical protein